MPIPNINARAVDWIYRWNLDGLIFTGGNSIGDCAVRDQTEMALLSHAVETSLPVFGVCRGLQLINTFFGGDLIEVATDVHVRNRHSVNCIARHSPVDEFPETFEVNSYHNFGVSIESLAKPLKAFAVTQDGLAEGLRNPRAPIVAIQWHPEREADPARHDTAMIRALFGLNDTGRPKAASVSRQRSKATCA